MCFMCVNHSAFNSYRLPDRMSEKDNFTFNASEEWRCVKTDEYVISLDPEKNIITAGILIKESKLFCQRILSDRIYMKLKTDH